MEESYTFSLIAQLGVDKSTVLPQNFHRCSTVEISHAHPEWPELVLLFELWNKINMSQWLRWVLLRYSDFKDYSFFSFVCTTKAWLLQRVMIEISHSCKHYILGLLNYYIYRCIFKIKQFCRKQLQLTTCPYSLVWFGFFFLEYLRYNLIFFYPIFTSHRHQHNCSWNKTGYTQIGEIKSYSWLVYKYREIPSTNMGCLVL